MGISIGDVDRPYVQRTRIAVHVWVIGPLLLNFHVIVPRADVAVPYSPLASPCVSACSISPQPPPLIENLKIVPLHWPEMGARYVQRPSKVVTLMAGSRCEIAPPFSTVTLVPHGPSPQSGIQEIAHI